MVGKNQQDTVVISPAEWRWVFVLGGMFTALTLLTYAFALLISEQQAHWQFMGILAAPIDGAAHLAKMGLGLQGSTLTYFLHTPDPHAGAGIDVFYLLLGWMARLLGISNLMVFHLVRVLASLYMYSALYWLGAAIWSRIRPRRMFFLFVTISSGFGWVLLLAGRSLSDIPDFAVASAYPFFAAYASPHLPIALGCLALITAHYIGVFRIDFRDEPTASNGGLLILVCTLIIAFLYPIALVPFGISIVGYWMAMAYKRREIPIFELRWLMLYVLPGGLLAFYYVVVFQNNAVIGDLWQMENPRTMAAWVVPFGYGLILLAAMPGILRGVRHFEADGDRLMVIWFVTNSLLVLMPSNFQHSFYVGLIIPLVFFLVRSLEDYWLPRVPGRERILLGGLLAVSVVSTILVFWLPLQGVRNPQEGVEQYLLLDSEYYDSFTWLANQPEAIVLSAPNVGLWVPVYGHQRVVYGHPNETLRAPEKLAQVEAWYSGEDCYWPTLDEDNYAITYVIIGPQEIAISAQDGASDRCFANIADDMEAVYSTGTTTVYRVP